MTTPKSVYHGISHAEKMELKREDRQTSKHSHEFGFQWAKNKKGESYVKAVGFRPKKKGKWYRIRFGGSGRKGWNRCMRRGLRLRGGNYR